ncbi:MAG: methyltransferase domain-containing protein [Candidatus Parvarchaeota archaeon]|jgi:tRNA (adenine57-N1/adenine58-N1)-methyltransferase|nr:methyltransferase domain-containing protein [Candidatus Parvarchaeota archaeon]
MQKKVLLIGEGASLYIDPSKDVNTEFGIIKSSKLLKTKPGGLVKTHTGRRFFLVDMSTPDLARRIIRLPQIITLKDLGSIIMYLGIKPDSKVLEAGTGSGLSTCVIGQITVNGSVTSYEIRKDFAKIANKNVALFGLKNIKIINSDIKKGVKSKDFDSALLDLPDPWEVLPVISKNIKIGGRICTYLPSIIQVEKTIRKLPDGLKPERLIENREINWKMDVGRDVLRPESSGILHTGFLLFIRKYGK